MMGNSVYRGRTPSPQPMLVQPEGFHKKDLPTWCMNIDTSPETEASTPRGQYGSTPRGQYSSTDIGIPWSAKAQYPDKAASRGERAAYEDEPQQAQARDRSMRGSPEEEEETPLQTKLHLSSNLKRDAMQQDHKNDANVTSTRKPMTKFNGLIRRKIARLAHAGSDEEDDRINEQCGRMRYSDELVQNMLRESRIRFTEKNDDGELFPEMLEEMSAEVGVEFYLTSPMSWQVSDSFRVGKCSKRDASYQASE